MKMLSDAERLIFCGMKVAVADYVKIAKLSWRLDVKPKEDQLKCAIYHTFSEARHLVHVERAYERGGGECDLVIASSNPVAIEIKTAWAGKGWCNKPKEQAETWDADIRRLQGLRPQSFSAGYFILLFAYESDTRAEMSVREKLSTLGTPTIHISPTEMNEWNGLNRLECMAYRIF